MNKQEAKRMADEVASRSRATTRGVTQYLDRQETFDVVAPSGTRYQIEVEAFWDDRKDKNLRVAIAIDDFGWSTFHPLVVAFIVAPDGRFVGE
jgi:hypothetical protein